MTLLCIESNPHCPFRTIPPGCHFSCWQSFQMKNQSLCHSPVRQNYLHRHHHHHHHHHRECFSASRLQPRWQDTKFHTEQGHKSDQNPNRETGREGAVGGDSTPFVRMPFVRILIWQLPWPRGIGGGAGGVDGRMVDFLHFVWEINYRSHSAPAFPCLPACLAGRRRFISLPALKPRVKRRHVKGEAEGFSPGGETGVIK